ncbi:Alpha-mannosyltransferase [Penicillium lagena]|uniref:Alpha-mannosyltransferase n=1 Tax=Penicillium lagena TaxID=94218 RepID=UPI002540DB30|nr:Alpha-mannosyltransferase [Penicillium lagena]KAJ5613067.1 Alpha-mannosyltransferase [Penicillium lagena]
MVFPRFLLRIRTLLGVLFLIAFLTWGYTRYDSDDYRIIFTGPDTSAQVSVDLTEHHRWFWYKFHPLLEKYGPDADPLIEEEKAPTEGFKATNPASRPDYLSLSAAAIVTMKESHTGFVDVVTHAPPLLRYMPGTKGLVSTAGGSYLPVLVISLRMLRRTGSKLPMEVFLADDSEYEEHICEVVLPALNARCIVLSHILNVAPTTISKYQFKPFAMLFSSFEDILFLDADAFPLEKPDVLFKSEPFRSKGMITWPDFWASSASPLFYEIVGQPVPAMDLRQSTESGEIVMSKSKHLRTLLLCTYYNYWGPTHYYPLLSQGAAGEGDKETFVAAATAMNEPFYQVSEPICALGHATAGGLAGSAMAQFDPVADFALTRQGKWRIKGDSAPAPPVFFIHANFPKFNPATVFTSQAVNPAIADDGSYTRAWTIPEKVVEEFSAKNDVEKNFWREILWTACQLEDKFRTWEGQAGICAGVKDYWSVIYGPEDPEPVS